MKAAREHRSGKGHKDENFPVASFVIEARHRGLILAFYEFVRIADDISDHATLSREEKLTQLDRLEAELLGSGDGQPEALRLRQALAERGMSAQHPCDVLTAFRMDVTKTPLRGLERAHPLLHLLGDAGRPLRARRARGEQVDLGCVGRPVRGAADHQPHPGLRQRLSQPRPRLHPAGRDAGLRHDHRDDRRRAFLTANDRGLARPDRGHRASAQRKPRARAAGQQHAPCSGNRHDPDLRGKDPCHAEDPRPAARAGPPEQMGNHGLRADQPRRRTVAPCEAASSPCRAKSREPEPTCPHKKPLWPKPTRLRHRPPRSTRRCASCLPSSATRCS